MGEIGDPLRWDVAKFEAARGMLKATLEEVRDGYVLEPPSDRVGATTERELVEHPRALVQRATRGLLPRGCWRVQRSSSVCTMWRAG